MTIAASLNASGIVDVIVVLKSAVEPDRKMTTLDQRLASHFTESETSHDGALVEMLNAAKALPRGPAAAGHTSALTLAAAKVSSPKVRHYPHLGLALGTVDRHGLAALRHDPSVDDVVEAPQLRLIRPVTSRAAKVRPGMTWGLTALGVDKLHGLGLTGKGVRIGHLDTGVDASHPALAGVVASYAEFDALGNQVPHAKPTDSGDHGTHTAGTIAGQPIKGVQFGVAPGAKLASAMVIEGGNVIARILGGMNWAVGQRVRILSMSLGLPGIDPAFLGVTQILRARGVLPVFAVGNEGPGSSRYPGNYAEALSVGAMDSQGKVAAFSCSQRFRRKVDPIVPDLVGPGVGVVSCVPGGKYKSMSGTSMATPHIAGLAALLMEAKPSKSIDEIETAIFKSCSLKPGMLPARANRGFPDALRALQLL